MTQVRPGEDLARALADEVRDEEQLVEPEAVPEADEPREQQDRPEDGVCGGDQQRRPVRARETTTLSLMVPAE